MFRTVFVALLSLLLISVAAAQEKIELRYQAHPGLQLVTEAEGTSEGHIWGNAPSMENVSVITKEKRKLLGELGEPSDDTSDMKVTGEVTTEMTFNGEGREPRTEPLAPVVFTFDERGQVVRAKPEPFEASGRNLLRFRWWRYIVQQLDLPPVLPDGPVVVGDTWDSVANLTGPDGKPLKGKAQFRLLGASHESEGQTAWIRGELVLPVELQFRTDEGEYKVDGKVRLDRVYAFDIDKGLPRGSRDLSVVDMSIVAKTSSGEEYRVQLFMHAGGKTVMKPKPAASQEAKTE
jgi:hypothetical protein